MAREIRTSVDIEAPVERVWSVLADFGRYGEWNPFIPRLEGEPKVGARLTETVQVPGGKAMTFKPTVLAWDPPREIRWVGKVAGGLVFAGDHAIRVQPLDKARTRVEQVEVFGGAMVPFMGKLLADTERGYHGMNAALKARCERGA